MVPTTSTALPAKVRELQEGLWEIDAIEDPAGSTQARRIFATCRDLPAPPTGLRIEPSK